MVGLVDQLRTPPGARAEPFFWLGPKTHLQTRRRFALLAFTNAFILFVFIESVFLCVVVFGG